MGLGIIAQPAHIPAMPVPTLESLTITDRGLIAQREFSYNVLKQCQDIRIAYTKDNYHNLINVDNAIWALQRTDHTSLNPTQNEDAQWMHRLANEALHPFPMRSVCTRPDENLILPLVEHFQDNPNMGISMVINYPHGDQKPETTKKQLDQWANFFAQKNIKNPIDIDSVLNIGAWMKGDFESVQKSLEADAHAKELGFTWKLILSLMVHAHAKENKHYNNDAFRSCYDAGMMGLERGADCLKTSTGNGSKAPFHEFNKKDTGPIQRALPMLAALSDFNKKNNAQRFAKFSGGNESIIDAAILKFAAEQFLEHDAADKTVFGTSPRFRHELLKCIDQKTDESGQEPLFNPDILLPYECGLKKMLQSGKEHIPSRQINPNPV